MWNFCGVGWAQQVTEEEKVEVEEMLCGSLLSLVMKLNEEELKPLFFSLAHWKSTSGEEEEAMKAKEAAGGGDPLARRLVFYRVVSHLAEALRVGKRAS